MFSIQSDRFSEISAKSATNDIIEKLIGSKAIVPQADVKPQSVCPAASSQNAPNSSFHKDIFLSQKKRITLKSSTKLQVELLGKSSFKSGIDFTRSKIVYTELQKAQRSLVLLDYFHLLYIVTPYDEHNPPPMPDRNIFYKKVRFDLNWKMPQNVPLKFLNWLQYNQLDKNQAHTASVIGISESTAIKLMSGQMLKVTKQSKEKIWKKT